MSQTDSVRDNIPIIEVGQVQMQVVHKQLFKITFLVWQKKNIETAVPIQDEVYMPKHDIINLDWIGVI